MKYQVFDNGKPADCKGHKVHESWNNSIFNSFADAYTYADKWLGQYGGITLGINKPVDYSGYGDTIEIREIIDHELEILEAERFYNLGFEIDGQKE